MVPVFLPRLQFYGSSRFTVFSRLPRLLFLWFSHVFSVMPLAVLLRVRVYVVYAITVCAVLTVFLLLTVLLVLRGLRVLRF